MHRLISYCTRHRQNGHGLGQWLLRRLTTEESIACMRLLLEGCLIVFLDAADKRASRRLLLLLLLDVFKSRLLVERWGVEEAGRGEVVVLGLEGVRAEHHLILVLLAYVRKFLRLHLLLGAKFHFFPVVGVSLSDFVCVARPLDRESVFGKEELFL